MKNFLRRVSSLLFIIATFSSLNCCAAAEYDLILRNGKIVDGSGNPWFKGDVAIRGDRIVVVGLGVGSATQVIDASGLVIAPGFIDMHSHSDWVLFEDGAAQSKIRQGVTTEVIGESSSAGPFQDKLAAKTVAIKGRTIAIRRLRDYLAAIEQSGISVNLA
ncbi:MAG TPA: amidohydrolase family protein, partial [Candidatus Saccharimonadales bacterium]|nr:amidohydrolase family protein [Candidatus Saccharimonadales bacterium]